MEIADYQALCLLKSEEWFPEVAHDLGHHLIALVGEVGEFANIFKKIDRGSLELTPETQVELAMELADVLIYVLNMGAVMNIDLGAAVSYKMQINEERFGANSPDHTSGDAGTNNDDQVPDGPSAFVPIGTVSQPIQGWDRLQDPGQRGGRGSEDGGF